MIKLNQPMSLLLLSLLSTIICFSQSSADLDKLNGFKQFKFGMTPEQISNITPARNVLGQKNVTVYNYSGNDLSVFGGATVSSISLSFYKKRLFRINISFGTPRNPFTSDQFNVIREYFINSFGYRYSQLSDVEEMEILNGIAWQGQLVRLDYLRIKYLGQVSGYALFYRKDIESQQQRDELN